MSPNATAVLQALRDHVESVETIMPNGDRFMSVYLDNARAQLGMTPRAFAGYLSALQKAGVYKPVNSGDPADRAFGNVLLAKEAAPE